MKFKVRDGMVVHLRTKVDLGNEKFEYQETSIYAGQVVDLTAEQATDHAHKLEPAPNGKTVDKDAEAFLAGYAAPAAAPIGISAEQTALIQAVAAETAKAVAAALGAPAASTAAASTPPAP